MVANPADTRTKDLKVFDSSLRQLHDNLLRDYVDDDRSVIVALSRKGPKMLDVVFTADELKHLNIVTEFALPVIFRQMRKDVEYRLYIVDDAIYYGSTLLNLFREIEEYRSLYGLSLKIFGAYVAIQDRGSLRLKNYNIYGNSDIREGYGHYFVKQIMSVFRAKHRCMEVEFPVVTYRLKEDINLSQFRLQIKTLYTCCYEEFYQEGSILTVLLDQNDSQFSKYRIYPDGNLVHVAFMAPRIIPNTDKVLRGLMDSMPYSIKKIWEHLCFYLLDNDLSVSFSDVVQRNRRRNLISLANYIFSYQEYIFYKATIEDLLLQSGNQFSSYGISATALYQQIGSRSLAEDLKKALLEQTQLVDFHFPEILFSEITGNTQLYEELRFPSEEERRSLETHNVHMIRNSASYHEALSAIFFNQNLFIERWSRHQAYYEGRRLWFGYTHDALQSMVGKNFRPDLPVHFLTVVHQWLDSRIDQGCVVPQYILDSTSNQWVRVFRPGENEDVFLSHLSRFILHIYGIIEKVIAMGFIPQQFLCNMLNVVYQRLWYHGLKEQFDFGLTINKDNRLCIAKGDGYAQTEVLKLLCKMYIIENSDDEITISPRISDPEFQSQTTLDSDIQRQVDGLVYTVLGKFEESGTSVNSAQGVFNYYMNNGISDDEFVRVYKDVAGRLKKAVEMIEKNIDGGNHDYVSTQCREMLLDAFRYLQRYDVNRIFYLKQGLTEDEYWSRFENDVRFRSQTQYKRLIYLINIILSVFAVSDADAFVKFIKTSEQKYLMKMLKLERLEPLINQAISDKNISQLQHTHFFTGEIKAVLSDIEKG